MAILFQCKVKWGRKAKLEPLAPSERDRYLSAYKQAEWNYFHDRDFHSGINGNHSFLEGPSVEMCAVHDYIKGRYCPPAASA